MSSILRRRRPVATFLLAPAAVLGGLGLLQAQSSSFVPRANSPAAGAEGLMLQIESVKDNTLYQTTTGMGELSSGAGVSMFAGRTGAAASGQIRRAVMAFDVDSVLPAGATITSASIDVFCSRANGGAQTMTLQRLTSDWGEGTSDAGDPGGAGAPSTAGDATWIHTSYPSSLWTATGGDFVSMVSASTVVNAPDPYVFSSAQLATDVQDMLDNPANDFGWILRGNESSTNTAKRFDTHEINNPGSRPILTVTYTAPLVPLTPRFGLFAFALLLAGLGAWRLAGGPRRARA